MIEIENVNVVFGKQPDRALPLIRSGEGRDSIQRETGLVVGVQEANLKVEKGEICVLMGLSGSGKSSLLRCLNGLNSVTSGAIRIDDDGESIDFTRASEAVQRDLRTRRISMVFQGFALMPWLTVEENVGFGLELQGLPKAERREKVQKQLDLVGLTGWEKRRPDELSGGMRQRVGLARALATESDILLMDEPFSALDPLIRQQLQDELLALQAELNKTIVFVSHDLDEALKIGSRIAIMKDGEIVQQGRPQDIVLNPANEYVRNFVASTNPLSVLTVDAIMTPVSDLAPDDDGLLPVNGPSGDRLAVTDPVAHSTVRVRGETCESQAWRPGDAISKLASRPTRVPAHTPMRDAVEIRYHTGHGLLIGDDSELNGVVFDQELYHALLSKHLDDGSAA
ncbi:glycine betaine/proline transport system ATP-binding protein [Tamilnaduibacter salinus]|uniref:Quaternary amine transport ATP-binding protein n=1 Tax=Tamilnaduibacter salinus TaxID=1484056 RepID=A0A2U1CW83_9GAMM|nr:choline ABC transporter ATP-binding protein [Tamilnaduibacter salinus]PVY76265.1 glycine betaine/proline transport system ATP-binding protein [Tamilnaduibacter salinus]